MWTWFANSHTGPRQITGRIRGRTDGSTQPKRRSFSMIFLAPVGASTDGANGTTDRLGWRLNWLGSAMGKLKTVDELFEGRHFDREIIILCVRWYLRFKLSLRDLVEMMAVRGLSMA